MQPVGMILKAVEIREGRGAGGLGVSQARPIRMKVPLQRPRPHRQPGTGGLAMTVVRGYGRQGANVVWFDLDTVRRELHEK